MTEWSATFKRIEKTQWGDKVIFASKKGEWKPLDIKENLDLSGLVAEQRYKLFTEKNERGFYYLDHYEKVEARPPQAGNGKGGWGKPYDPLTFVSNVVGQAIQVGQIIKPEDIAPWANAAWAVTKEPGANVQGGNT